MSTEKMIDIGRQRDFGDLLQDSIRFVVWNAVPLLKAIVIFVGPLILLSGIFSVWYFQDMFGGINPMEFMQNPEALQDWAMSMAGQGPSPALTLLAGLIGLSVLVVRNIVFNSFIIRYKETQTGALNIQDMKDDVFKNFVPFIGLHLLQFVIVVLAVIVYAIVAGISIGLLGAALEGLGGVLGAIIAIALMVVMAVYVFIPLTFSYFIRLYEGPDNIAALRKSFKVMAASRWQTFALFIVLGIIAIVISAIVNLLGIGSIFGGGVMALIWVLISTIISTLVSVVYSTAAAMIYFNTVGDNNVNDSMIDEIGNDSPADPFS